MGTFPDRAGKMRIHVPLATGASLGLQRRGSRLFSRVYTSLLEIVAGGVRIISARKTLFFELGHGTRESPERWFREPAIRGVDGRIHASSVEGPT